MFSYDTLTMLAFLERKRLEVELGYRGKTLLYSTVQWSNVAWRGQLSRWCKWQRRRDLVKEAGWFLEQLHRLHTLHQPFCAPVQVRQD